MSHPLAVSRLWPVLTVLAGLITGALVLERVAEDRAAQPMIVTIHAGAVIDPEGEDGAEEEQLDDAIVDPRQSEARALGRRGEVGPAVETLRAVVADHPESPAPRAELAFWLLEAGQVSEALSAVDSALALQPDEARWHLRRGIALGRLGRDADAEAALRRALELRETLDRARILLGVRLRRRGDLDGARETLLPATTRGSNEERARALIELGQVLLLEGRNDEAADHFERGLNLAPAIPELRVRIGRAWIASGRGKEARRRGLAVLEKAAVLAPDLPMVHDALGRAYERLERPDEARLTYLKAISLDGDDTYARRRLLRLEMAEQAFSSARRQVERLLEVDAGNPEHHFLAGLLAARSGEAAEARQAYGRAIELRGGRYPEAHFNLGALERREGKLEASAAAYRAAVEHRPDYKAAINNLGLVLAEAGHNDEALAAFDEAIALDADYAIAHLNRGKLLTTLERYDEAEAALKQALAIRGDYPAATLDLGVVHLRQADPAEAVRLYQELVDHHPRYLLGRYNLGLALLQARKVDEARKSFEKALELDPSHLPSLRQLVGLDLEQEQPARALPHLREILDYAPDDLWARRQVARSHAALGELEACRRELAVLQAASSEGEDADLQALVQACAEPAPAP
ncbi:MAG: tetratricopeptide repeat protein [Deltaproteobacteria bacterium]|nr:tetratricopeptide repeat protein [Deltaproteobacteria bacterium]